MPRCGIRRRRNRRTDPRSPASWPGPPGCTSAGSSSPRRTARTPAASDRRGANAPVAIPSSMHPAHAAGRTRRAATITAFRCAGDSASRSRNSAVPCSSSRIVWTNATISRRSLSSAGSAAALDLLEQLHQPIERVLVAGEEDLFLVLEVVVEVPLLHVQRRGDLLDGGAVIAEPAERLGGALQDVDAGRRVADRRCAAACGAGTAGLRARGRREVVDSLVATVLKYLNERSISMITFDTRPDRYKHWKLDLRRPDRHALDGRARGRRPVRRTTS